MSTPNYIYHQALDKIALLEETIIDLTAQIIDLEHIIEEKDEYVEHVKEGRRFELLKLLIENISDAIDFTKNPLDNEEMVQLKEYVDFMAECGDEE